LRRRLGAATLTQNRRQREVWERDALAALRKGNVDRALSAYESQGRVTAGLTADATRDAMAADWWAARLAGEPSIMLAARWSDVDDLNARARARLASAGEVFGPTLEVRDRPMQAGDRVLALRNAYLLGLRNGTLGTVAA